jgi:hypothetical protein
MTPKELAIKNRSSIEFLSCVETICDECGNAVLIHNVKIQTMGKVLLELHLTPCQYCLKLERRKAYEEGWDEGYKEKEEETND